MSEDDYDDRAEEIEQDREFDRAEAEAARADARFYHYADNGDEPR